LAIQKPNKETFQMPYYTTHTKTQWILIRSTLSR